MPSDLSRGRGRMEKGQNLRTQNLQIQRAKGDTPTCRSAHLLLERYAKWEVFSLGFIIVQTKQNPRILHIKMHMAPGDGTWDGDGASCPCSYSCKCKFKFRFLCLLTSMLCYIPIPPHTTVPFLLRPIAIRWRTWHLACEYVRV
jgi:hypothetical protein